MSTALAQLNHSQAMHIKTYNHHSNCKSAWQQIGTQDWLQLLIHSYTCEGIQCLASLMLKTSFELLVIIYYDVVNVVQHCPYSHRLIRSFEIISSVYAQQLSVKDAQNFTFPSITLVTQLVSHCSSEMFTTSLVATVHIR